MAGLLTSKERIIDFILTPHGRSRVMSGNSSVKYVSFSDHGSSYDRRGRDDVVQRPSLGISLEAFSTQWDTVTVTTDESGTVNQFVGDQISLVRDGSLMLSGSTSGSFSDRAGLIVSATLDSLVHLQPLKTARNDKLSAFELCPKSHVFTLTDRYPFDDEPSTAHVDSIEPLYLDRRFNGSRFAYLPPVQPDFVSGSLVPLGHYTKLNEGLFDSDRLHDELSRVESMRFVLPEGSRESMYIMQMFEESGTRVEKLAVTKPVVVGGSSVCYAGKLFENSAGQAVFVSMFTLVIE